MKKILVTETLAIVMSIVIVITGYVLGWSSETIAKVVAIFATVTFALANLIILAATTVFAAASVAATLAIDFITLVAFAVVAALAALVANMPKKMYKWVFLSLLIEGITIWAILNYGPGLIKTMM